MSHASFVPETGGGLRDGVKEVTQGSGRHRLATDAVRRFVAADCASHARALAYSGVLVFIPALIALTGLTTVFGLQTVRSVVDRTVQGLAPGKSGEVLAQAIRQGSHQSGGRALIVGLIAAVAAGTFAMAQVERGANRMYGIEVDRPFVRRYTRALLLQLTAGSLLFGAVLLIAAGQGIADSLSGAGRVAALAIRWPLGVALAAIALTIVMKAAPNRKQPSFAWLLTGTSLAVILWIVSSVLLGLYFRLDTAASQTYGPLLGVIALLVWSYLSGISIYAGFAFAAQLEAERARQPGPTRDRIGRTPRAVEAVVH
jgi:YihY family inner membrane protein